MAAVERGRSCYPVNQAARRAAAERPAPPPHPRPEVVGMVVPADDPRVPVGARRLVAVGRANGWRTCVAYARGTAMDARGRPGRVVDDVGVRFQRGSQGAVAYWTDGGFDFAYLMTVVGGERSPVSTRLGARALRAALDTPEEQT